MKKKGLLFILSVALIFSLQLSPIVNAQQAQPQQAEKSEFTEATRPEENYLARFHALERVEYLMKSNIDKIYMLKIIVTNYKDQGWEKDYEACYNGYKKGMDYYYKRDVIYAQVELEKNRKDIYELYKKIADVYKQRTQALLNECASKILDLSLDERSKSNPDRNKVLFNNTARLRIAYGQYDDGQNMMDDHVYDTAVKHFRVAKSYAILILEDIDPENAKGKYDLDKADNMNRILNQPQTQAK